MDEKTRKIKYRYLLYQVNNIYSQINNLNNELNNLDSLLSENFLIDDNYVEKNNVDKIQTGVKSIQQELKNSVIPSIKYKI